MVTALKITLDPAVQPATIVVDISDVESLVINITEEGIIIDGYNGRQRLEGPVSTYARTYLEFLDN